MGRDAPSKKKESYPILPEFEAYLDAYGRVVKLPVRYGDLRHFSFSAPLMDNNGNDTLWETVYYNQYEKEELDTALKLIYALLNTEGDVNVLEHLRVDRIDFCTFGNTQPFRVRIINRLNDNYDHYYVKKADASRLYGLELEDLLSPNRINYLVYEETLIEEHIAGIPGDDFMNKHLDDSVFNQIRIAKEFVKFNERCFVRLLGDMRAYNYVVDITPDIEGSQFRLRAIDFDQQSYEGRKKFYLPQYFKENNPIIEIGLAHMDPKTVIQYQLEERSLIAVRVKRDRDRFEELISVMCQEQLSAPDKIEQLKAELGAHHETNDFIHCRNMGEIVWTNIKLVLRKDFHQSGIDFETL